MPNELHHTAATHLPHTDKIWRYGEAEIGINSFGNFLSHVTYDVSQSEVTVYVQ